MSALSIRLARKEDAGAIAEMLSKLADDLGDTDEFQSDQNTIRDYGFGDVPSFFCQVAISGDNQVGLSLYFPHFSTTLGKSGVYVQDLWVDAGMRSKSIGPDLLAATAQHAAKTWRAEYLKLTVYADNSGAGRFYERMGFTPLADDRPLLLRDEKFDELRGAL